MLAWNAKFDLSFFYSQILDAKRHISGEHFIFVGLPPPSRGMSWESQTLLTWLLKPHVANLFLLLPVTPHQLSELPKCTQLFSMSTSCRRYIYCVAKVFDYTNYLCTFIVCGLWETSREQRVTTSL